jgi:hypothetical protein
MKPFDPDPATYPSWLKVSIIEGAIQKMEAPRQVYLTSRASFKLMDAQNRQYLDEAFRLAYRITSFSNNDNDKEYRKLISVLVKMWKGE